MAEEGKNIEVQRTSPARGLSPLERMERMFESFFPGGWMRPSRREWPSWEELASPLEVRTPRVDVIDREDEIVVRAELPCVDKKDIDVSMSDNAVTIRGSSSYEKKEEREDYYYSEMSKGVSVRTVPLPVDVEGDKAKATFKDGVLEITVPKMEKSKRRQISVE